MNLTEKIAELRLLAEETDKTVTLQKFTVIGLLDAVEALEHILKLSRELANNWEYEPEEYYYWKDKSSDSLKSLSKALGVEE